MQLKEKWLYMSSFAMHHVQTEWFRVTDCCLCSALKAEKIFCTPGNQIVWLPEMSNNNKSVEAMGRWRKHSGQVGSTTASQQEVISFDAPVGWSGYFMFGVCKLFPHLVQFLVVFN